MIDSASEKLLPPDELVGHLPPHSGGKPRHPASLYRWMDQGLRGVRLEFIQIGGARYSSREALSRFLNELTSRAIKGKGDVQNG